MPEQENTTGQENGEQPNTPPSENNNGGQTDPLAELPEWAQKEIKTTRAEAANYRTRLREVEKELSEAKTPEEFAAALADLNKKNTELEVELTRTKVARQFSLPDELVALVQGPTREDMEKAAELLAKHAKVETVSYAGKGGGLNPTQGPAIETDPRKLQERFPRR